MPPLTAAQLLAILAQHIAEGADPNAEIMVWTPDGARVPITRCYRLGDSPAVLSTT